MDDHETSVSGRRSPKAGPVAGPNEAELSRIAREAVHQPPDPRLDRQLARMGVTEASAAAEAQPGQPTSRSIESGSELERLNTKLRRIEVILVAIVAAVGILALIDAILLFR